MREGRIYIYGEQCDQCGACLAACPVNAISLSPGGLEIDRDTCTLCLLCVKACERKALTFERGRRSAGSAKGKARGVWVFIESPGPMNHACLQIVSKGYELARSLREDLVAVVVTREETAGPAGQLLPLYGVDEIRYLSCPQLEHYHAEDVAAVLAEDILDQGPRIVLFLGSRFGRELAPRVAARLNTGLTADCTELRIDARRRLVQVRPTYGGKILASIICPFHYPQMASVRQNVFQAVKRPRNGTKIPLRRRTVEIDSIERVKLVLGSEPFSRLDTRIEEAEVIVCGGAGLGTRDGFELLETLAGKIGGAVAGTRAVVDLGWIPFSRQVGQTGKTVRPRLYIGCGVSGAIHHLMGMKHSGEIIAINSDPRAPIFKVATVGIVGDLYEVVPQLIDQL